MSKKSPATIKLLESIYRIRLQIAKNPKDNFKKIMSDLNLDYTAHRTQYQRNPRYKTALDSARTWATRRYILSRHEQRKANKNKERLEKIAEHKSKLIWMSIDSNFVLTPIFAAEKSAEKRGVLKGVIALFMLEIIVLSFFILFSSL